MNKLNFSMLKSHRKKILSLLIMSVIFSLLIMEAIHLISINNPNSPDSDSKSQSQSESTSNNNNQQNDNNSNDDQGSTNKPDDSINQSEGEVTAGEGEFNKENGSIERKPGEFSPQIDEELRSSFPDLSIDLSRRNNSSSNGNGGSGNGSGGNGSSENGEGNGLYKGNSFVVKTGVEPQHIPIAEIAGITGTSYLRLYTMSNYEDDVWSLSRYSAYEPYQKPIIDENNLVEIKPFKADKGYMPVLANKADIIFPNPCIMEFPQDGMYYADAEISEAYKIRTSYSFHDSEALEKAAIMTKKYYVNSYEDIIKNLAYNITLNCKNNYEKVLEIKKYLLDNYTFVKNESQGPVNVNALYDFLFERKAGTPLDFVSACVNLLRCSGVSARVATGFKIDPNTNYQIVYKDQFSVFPEIETVDYGWVPFELLSQNQFVPPLQTTTNITEVESVVKKGEFTHVKGTVTSEDKKTVNNLPVLIYIKKNKDDGCIANAKGKVKNGKFDIQCTLDYEMEVGNYNVVAHTAENNTYRGSWSDPEIKVVTDTTLEVDFQTELIEGNSYSLKGNVIDIGGKKIENAKIKFTADNGLEIKSVKVTDENKNYVINESLTLGVTGTSKAKNNYFFLSSYKAYLDAKYEGSEFYLPCSKSFEIIVWKIDWVRIIVALVIIVIAIVLLVFILNWRKRKKSLKNLRETTEANLNIDEAETIDKAKTLAEEEANENQIEEIKISIEFPQIPIGFPDVWGINTPLTAIMKYSDDGFEKLEVTFDKKGLFAITIFNISPRRFVSDRKIKIVLYEEEIICLGNKLFKRLFEKFPGHDFKKLTPREITEFMGEKLNGISKKELTLLREIFENSAYATVSISRKNYEDFYLIYVKLMAGLEEI